MAERNAAETEKRTELHMLTAMSEPKGVCLR